MTRPVRIAAHAAAQIESASDWWFENRSFAQRAFDDNLERAIELISSFPGVGQPVAHTRRVGIRRVSMGRVRYHLYYVDAGDAVEILALWHESRGSGPDL